MPNPIITVQLTHSDTGDLIVILPKTQTQQSGQVTLSAGTIETGLRNILEIETRIKINETRNKTIPVVSKTNQILLDLEL